MTRKASNKEFLMVSRNWLGLSGRMALKSIPGCDDEEGGRALRVMVGM